MTARVTTLHGGDAGRYYVDGPRGYYLDGDEAPGRWRGLGAVVLGPEVDLGSLRPWRRRHPGPGARRA